jgi:hypothetical protein
MLYNTTFHGDRPRSAVRGPRSAGQIKKEHRQIFKIHDERLSLVLEGLTCRPLDDPIVPYPIVFMEVLNLALALGRQRRLPNLTLIAVSR